MKNEADIIARSLEAAAKWSDFIYVYDNGSTDGTWQIVVELSKRLQQVVPFRQEDVPFRDQLRKIPFNHYRRELSSNDWWCILDADEYYIDCPREFLAGVPPRYDTVWAACFQFYLTEKDLDRFRRDPSLYGDDIPVEEKCRYYINNWSEPKFIRHSARLRWWWHSKPFPLMRAYERRIRMKHYQYRSPQQIERRLATRRNAMRRGIFAHETFPDWAQSILGSPTKRSDHLDHSTSSSAWTDRVVSSSKLIYDDRSKYVITEDWLPKITDSRVSLKSRLKYRLYCAVADMLPY